MILADVIGTVGGLGSVVAAGAALVTVLYARSTVVVARAGRRDAHDAHGEEMREHARLFEATKVANEQEIEARERALRAELVLERLSQLGRVEEMLGEIGDIARFEIAQPPPLIGAGPGRWSRVTGALTRLEAAIGICERLGIDGTVAAVLSEAKLMSNQRRGVGTPPTLVVSEAMMLLSRLGSAIESDESLLIPSGERAAATG
jgi:hypothetical protein